MSVFDSAPAEHPCALLGEREPLYQTRWGAAIAGDSLELMGTLPAESVNLVLTSPPYALEFQKEYGNVEKGDYVGWFLPFAREIKRILKPDGSFVLNIGGSYNLGAPTRSLYHFKLLVALVEEIGFYLAQECFWYNPAKLPAPAEWVNVQRVRIKDSVEYVWWLARSTSPKADNRDVLVPYSKDMKRLIQRGLRETVRPSGHVITEKFTTNRGGSIPPNLIYWGNNDSNSDFMKACEAAGVKPHPARFPAVLPEFFIRLLTDSGDLVLDPFAGSNTTGRVAEDLGRRWLGFELDEDYLRISGLRFGLELLRPKRG
ncbi:MAG: site-specific DNA-methyltransferase [Gemmatimonadetes bacterium]|nr:site-specific DNA-methyltransferase [Gemmatimonadota bacterium]